MSKYLYADANQKPVGPVSLEALDHLCKESLISERTLIIEEGGSSWVAYGDLLKKRRNEQRASAVVDQVEKVGKVVRSLPWVDFFVGFVLIIIQVLTLPWVLIKGAAALVVEWGAKRELPTSQSEVPVLTFLTVVLRPLWVLLAVFFGVIICISSLFMDRTYYWFWGSVSRTPVDRIAEFIVGIGGVYFGVILISFCFDLASLFIGMANSLKEMSRKSSAKD